MTHHHELCLVLKLPKGFIPLVESPSLRFLTSFSKSRYNQLIFFHWEESTGRQSIPSQFLPSECHVSSFASSPLANRGLNLGMIGRFHNTFIGGPFFVFSILLHSSSSFSLYHDTLHLGHLCISSNSCLYNMKSLGHA